MKYKTTVVFWICILSIVNLTNCKDNTMANKKDYLIKIPDFSSQSSSSISKDVDQIVNSHNAIVANIVEQLQKEAISDENKLYAIYLVGQMRAIGAISTLIENIDFPAPKADSSVAIGRWGMYPAQEALSKIGQPAVNMILDKLPGENHELRRRLMCFVLVDVDGIEVAQFMLKHSLAKETDPSRKGNLQSALMILEGLPK